MNVLILGSGGREHAIAKKIDLSSSVEKVFVSPGNGGTATEYENIKLNITPPYTEVIEFVKNNDVGLVVVGPELYLVDGVVDFLSDAGIPTFGPSKDAARLEGSKEFAKKIMKNGNVPTSDYDVFTDQESALEYLQTVKMPVVLKADGLAAGKGVIICITRDEAISSLDVYFKDQKFGSAGTTLVIESFLTGVEASILAFTDGKTIRTLTPSQDHKRIFNNDEGPNTGGMGVYTPLKFYTANHQKIVEDKILRPTLESLKKEGIVYKGILYAGLMIDSDEINVVEYNVRFGDPETECVLPLLKSDLAEIMLACYNGTLDMVDFELEDKAACTVVMASGGYPGDYKKGLTISGLSDVKKSTVYHAGTAVVGSEQVTSGGRVLALTAMADTLGDAIDIVYNDVNKITFEGVFYRDDIGKKGLS